MQLHLLRYPKTLRCRQLPMCDCVLSTLHTQLLPSSPHNALEEYRVVCAVHKKTTPILQYRRLLQRGSAKSVAMNQGCLSPQLLRTTRRLEPLITVTALKLKQSPAAERITTIYYVLLLMIYIILPEVRRF